MKDYESKRFASRQNKMPSNQVFAASTAYADERAWRHQGKAQSLSHMTAAGLRPGLKQQRSAHMGRVGQVAGVATMEPGSRSSAMAAQEVPLVYSDDSMERIGEHEAGEAEVDLSTTIKEQAQRYYEASRQAEAQKQARMMAPQMAPQRRLRELAAQRPKTKTISPPSKPAKG